MIKLNPQNKWLMVMVIAMSILFASCSKEQDAKDGTFSIQTKIISINMFGNLVLDISDKQMDKVGFEFADMVSVECPSLPKTLEIPYINDYMMVGTWGISLNSFADEATLTLALTNSSFHDRVGGKVGDNVTITLSKKGGFINNYRNLHLPFSEDRADYASDEAFVNFHSVKGGVGDGKLYRSCKPLMGPNKNSRYIYADELARKAGVNTIISLSDSEDDWQNALNTGNVGKYSKELYQNNSLALHKMGIDFYLPATAREIGEVMRYMNNRTPPYLICCTMGRDRTGLLSIMLGILTGATYQELEAGYMKSYLNLHNITKSHAGYQLLKKITFDRILYIIHKQGKIDIAEMNAMNEIDVASFFPQLPANVELYLTQLSGLEKAEMDGVISKLR